MSSRRSRIVAAVLATASALAIGGGALATSPASAFPVRICSPEGCKSVCRHVEANGNVVDYDEGTKITVTNPDGNRQTYTCKNGEWVATARKVRPLTDAVVSTNLTVAPPR
jgi:hypothetical protein